MESPRTRYAHLLEEDGAPQFSGSGRVRDLMILRRKKFRPFSAANADGKNAAGRSLKSKGIPYNVEELYDKNLQLKSEVNELKAESMKLKTKMKQMEGKMGRRLPDNQPFLIDSLKKQVSELKLELQMRDDKSAALKKKLKFTRLTEMETELKVANDESIRLNRMLMEAMEELAKGVMPLDLQERFLKLKVDYKGLKREFFELTAYVKDNKPRSVAFRVEPAKTRKSAVALELRNENAVLAQEVQKLKEQLLVHTKCPNCGSRFQSVVQTEEDANKRGSELLLHRLWTAVLSSGLTIPDFWQRLDPEMLGAVKPHALIELLATLDFTPTTEEVAEIFDILDVTQGESVHRSVLEDALEQCRPPLSIEQQNFISHFSLKLQELRKELDQIPVLLKLPEPHCTIEYFTERLEKSLLRFKPAISKGIAEVCFLGYKLIPTERLYARITDHLGPVEFPLPEEEAALDSELRSLYQKRGGELLSRLQQLNTRGEGAVTFEQFLEASTALGIVLPPRLQKYLRVLFYADRQELNQVPYEAFIGAFCTANT